MNIMTFAGDIFVRGKERTKYKNKLMVKISKEYALLFSPEKR